MYQQNSNKIQADQLLKIIEFIGGMNPVSRQICAFIAFGNRYIWPLYPCHDDFVIYDANEHEADAFQKSERSSPALDFYFLCGGCFRADLSLCGSADC